MNFDQWWNEDYDDKGNPFERDSFGYWAYAGWCGAQQQKLETGCAECGCKASDGYALYCVKCSEPMREWVGLTKDDVDSWTLPKSPTIYEFAKYVESKIKEKNT